jgi:hypothetical protein
LRIVERIEEERQKRINKELIRKRYEILRVTKEEAIKILEEKLNEYRQLSYSELVKKIGEAETFEGKSAKGEDYQIEMDFFYDGREETDLRVLGMISYSDRTSYSPVCSDFIISPEGKFIGE